MTIIDNENIRPFDVDGTLIVPYDPNAGQFTAAFVFDPVDNKTIKVTINQAMTRMIREEYHRGGYVIVWSRSGKEWATNVVRALGLQEYVHLVMSKPTVYFDDLPVGEWLKDRVFLPPTTRYKR